MSVGPAVDIEQSRTLRDPRPFSNGVHTPEESRRTAHVAVIIVTWNRKAQVSVQLEAIAGQTFGAANCDVIVVDNASTDGTQEYLAERWRPEATVHNQASVAHEPRFIADPQELRIGSTPRTNAGGFRSLTIVRNAENFGGCGGFNTGFAFVHRFVGVGGGSAGQGASQGAIQEGSQAGGGPEFAWLADDDAIADSRALEHLVATMRTDPKIGLVGSRTVDIADRLTTIESTIYFNSQNGLMGDAPVVGHPMHQSHLEWIAKTGGTKGRRELTGIRDVDVVSACSLLARWSMVREVGFWDYRYFIYCDDADWALRFGNAGHRVVLSNDAVVYHTPWILKLTPARLYYSQRNIVWMLQKVVPANRARPVTFRWLGSFIKTAFKSALGRRRTIGLVYQRAALDAATGVWGKINFTPPPVEDVFGALERLGALKQTSRIAVLCNNVDTPLVADEVRGLVTARLIAAGRTGDLPEWTYVVRNDIRDYDCQLADRALAARVPGRIVYAASKRSKLFRQLSLLLRPPKAFIVFDHVADFPLLCGGHNIHIDRKEPGKGFVEEDGVRSRIRFLFTLAKTLVRTSWYALTFKRDSQPRRAEGPEAIRYG